MKNDDVKRLDSRYSFRVDPCIDSDDWVWTLLCDGQNLSDGYEATKKDVEKKARQAYADHLEYLNETP